MSIFTLGCIIGGCYAIYKYVKSNTLTTEQKELLIKAVSNQIVDEEIKMKFIKKEITLEKAIQSQKEKIDKESRVKAEKEKAEKELIERLSSANNRTYFCYSLVNTESLLYLVNPETNSVLESSATNLTKLYFEGWRLIDVDKTGKNAQLDSLNAVVRLEKTSNY